MNCNGHWMTVNGQMLCLHHLIEECPGRSSILETLRDPGNKLGWYDGLLVVALILSMVSLVSSIVSLVS